jgi:hypothetical protein
MGEVPAIDVLLDPPIIISAGDVARYFSGTPARGLKA